MKFARYLKDTQTPEWQRAYIDYRGLKKLITAIKKAQGSGKLEPLEELSETHRASTHAADRPSSTSHSTPLDATSHASYGSTGRTPPLETFVPMSPPPVDLPEPALPLPSAQNGDHVRRSAASMDAGSFSNVNDAHRMRLRPNRAKTDFSDMRSGSSMASSLPDQGNVAEPSPATGSSPGGFLSHLRRRQSARTHQRTDSRATKIALPLMVILPTLSPLERQFIEKLDKELEKVENFYRAREQEAIIRASMLKEQLRELQDHRKLFHDAKAAESTWASLPGLYHVVDKLSGLSIPRSVRGLKDARDSCVKDAHFSASPSHVPRNGKERENSRSTSPHARGAGGLGAQLDPDEYKSAKRDLKKAILEFYRGLELLNNYRVLNLTGFRKALKKFEKTIRVHIQQPYMQEKVEVSALASGESIEKLLKDMEDQYAARFQRGDLKRARERLRATAKDKTHHFSTFRTGLYLGLVVPAFVDGLYKSFQPDVRASLPSWNALLYIYGTLMLPVLFSLLVGLNIWVWNRSRINYQFIFELDVRTQLDSRQYFELPAFFLVTLAYAFWLSFSLIGTSHVAPTTWPLVWVVFALVVLFNPLRIMFLDSRWWLIRKIGRLLVPGTKPVDFTDFWLGDQFCSLLFTLSNLYFFVCSYDKNWDAVWATCSQSLHWGVPVTLGILPLIIRAIQSVKRYVDSRLYTHLINCGKYCSSIVYYIFYYSWRHHGTRHDYTLVLFCFFATFATLYTCAWDLLMDWSLFKRPSQHPFLRKDLVYSSNYFVYYIAIVLNILIRFVWIVYVVDSELDIQERAFIAASFEMLRRWQWNFFRLENEHIGNTDQYRVTREVPLPYRIDSADHDTDDEGDEDDDEHFSTKSSWRRRPVQMARIISDEERQRPSES
ncbi:hypothetical protein M0805_002105 [Coniferiporia weirii]|nr:hypothetical protein M0805_002105 [Coniferiporia weirii]